jgi:hypothetical protein
LTEKPTKAANEVYVPRHDQIHSLSTSVTAAPFWIWIPSNGHMIDCGAVHLKSGPASEQLGLTPIAIDASHISNRPAGPQHRPKLISQRKFFDENCGANAGRLRRL